MLPFGISGREYYAPQPQAQVVAQQPIIVKKTQVVDHEPHRCKAIAKSGNRCKKAIQKPSPYCDLHRKIYEKTHKVE